MCPLAALALPLDFASATNSINKTNKVSSTCH
jgi:hypothetical protein